MKVLTKSEFLVNEDEYAKKIKDGAVFIYPTDTIYGLGCNALIPESVKRIRKLKQRPDQPFSVIIPSAKWLHDNCEVKPAYNKYIEQLPGPSTLIFKLKNKDAIAKNVNPNLENIGVRVPKHWFTRVVKDLKVPIVTTSANVSGGTFMTTLEDLNENIKHHVDFIIYEGEKTSKPSKVIDLSGDKPAILRK